MSDILVELGLKEVLSNRHAAGIKGYISNKYGNLSHQKRAQIFADAVNRIVDRSLPRFPEEQQKRLKERLFRSVVGKAAFSIDYSDVFTASLEMKTVGNQFFKGLVPWLEEALGREVPKERVFSFVLQSHQKMAAFPEQNIRDIIRTLEQELSTREETDFSHLRIPPEAGASPLETRRKQFHFPGVRLRSLGRVVMAAGFCGILLSSLINISNAEDGVSGAVAGTVSTDSPSIVYLPLPMLSSREILADLLARTGRTDDRKQHTGSAAVLEMVATAYDLSVESCGKNPGHPAYGVTFTGTRAKAGRTVAVDPEVIPLGSRLYIKFPEEYRHMNGLYVAEDTGKLVQGKHIDIFFGEDRAGSREVYRKAMKFGVRTVEVTVLDEDSGGRR